MWSISLKKILKVKLIMDTNDSLFRTKIIKYELDLNFSSIYWNNENQFLLCKINKYVYFCIE